MAQYIYLLIEREFIRLKENVYKIGRTKQLPEERMAKYPKDSEVLLFVRVTDCIELETRLIRLFKEKFEQMTRYGTEYFKGDSSEMMNEIFAAANKTEPIVKKVRPKIIIDLTTHEHANSDESKQNDSANSIIANSVKPTEKQNFTKISTKTPAEIIAKYYGAMDSDKILKLVNRSEKLVITWKAILSKLSDFWICDAIYKYDGEYFYTIRVGCKTLFRLNFISLAHNKFSNITLYDKNTIVKINTPKVDTEFEFRLCMCSVTNIIGEICYRNGGKEFLCMIKCGGVGYIISINYPDKHKKYWETLYGRADINCDKCDPCFMVKTVKQLSA